MVYEGKLPEGARFRERSDLKVLTEDSKISENELLIYKNTNLLYPKV